MLFGSDRHNDAPTKLNAFWPREVRKRGRFNCEVEDARVLYERMMRGWCGKKVVKISR